MTAYSSYWDDDELGFDPEMNTQPEFSRLHQNLSNPYAVVPYMKKNEQAKRENEMDWGDYFDAAWTGAKHGVTTYGPEQLYRAVRTMSRMVGSVADTSGIEQWATAGIDENIAAREKDPWYRPDPKWMESSWGRSLYGGFSSFTSSMMTYLPGAAIAAAAAPVTGGTSLGALLFSGAAYLAGSGASAAIAGLAEYDSFMDEVFQTAKAADPSITYDMIASEKFWGAVMSAISETGTEFLGDYVGGKAAKILPGASTKLTEKLSSVLGKLASDPVAGLIARTTNNMVNNIATELGSEAANAALQDYIRQINGMSHKGRMEAIKEIIGPTIVSGALGGIKHTIGSETKATMKDVENALRSSDRERRVTTLTPEAVAMMDNLAAGSTDNGKSAYETALVMDALAKRTSEETGAAHAEVIQGIDPRSPEIQNLVQAVRNQDTTLADVVSNGYAFLESRLTNEARDSMRDAFMTPEGVVDTEGLLGSFQQFARDGKLDSVPETAQPGFSAMRNVLTDSVMAMDNLSFLRPSKEALNVLRTEGYQRPKGTVVGVNSEAVAEVLTRWKGKDLTDPANLTEFMVEALPHMDSNFTSPDSATDTAGIFKDMYQAYKPLIDQIQAGTPRKSKKDVVEKAKAYLENVNGWELLSDTFKNVENTDEKQVAIGMVMMTAEAHAQALAKTIVASENFNSPIELQYQALAQNIELIRQADKGIRREVARALNARKFRKTDPRYAEMNQAYLNALGDPQARKLALIAVANADTSKRSAEIRGLTFGKRVADAVMENVSASMLSAPSTHLVNMMGNAVMDGLHVTERAFAERMMPQVREGVQRGETASLIWGYWESIANARKIWKTHRDQYDTGFKGWVKAVGESEHMWNIEDTKAMDAGTMQRSISSKRLGLSKEHGMVSGALATMVDLYGSVTHIPFALLGHEDGFFKSIYAGAELRGLLKREARGDKARFKELLVNPPRDLIEMAQQSARHAVFQDKLDPFTKHFDQMRNSFPLLRYFIPFLKTPVNIFKEGVSLTPVFNRLMGTTRERLNSTDVATRQLAEAHVMLGNLIWSTSILLASAGCLTGPGPEDPEKRNRKMATGWLPNSLVVGGKHIQIDRLDPLALIFNGAAFMVEAFENLDQEDREKGMLTGIAQGMRAVMSRTYMSSLNDFMDLFLAGEKGIPALERRLGSTMWPGAALGRAINRSDDGFLRESQSFWDGLYQSVPGLSKELPVRRDFLGQPVEDSDYLGPKWLSPFRVGKAKSDPVYREVARLQELGLNAASLPSKTIQHKGRAVRLNGTEYSAFLGKYGSGVSINGRTAKQAVNQLIQSHRYSSLSDADKAKEISKTLGRYARQGKREFIGESSRVQQALQVKSQGWEFLLGNSLR